MIYLLNFFFTLFLTNLAGTVGIPGIPSENLTVVAEPARLVHNHIPSGIVPTEFRFCHLVAVFLETGVGLCKLLFAFIGFVPLNIVNQSHDSKAGVQCRNTVTQPVRETVGTDTVIDGAKLLHIVFAENFGIVKLKALRFGPQLFEFFESVHTSPLLVNNVVTGSTAPTDRNL